jgi:hypothetical protein
MNKRRQAPFLAAQSQLRPEAAFWLLSPVSWLLSPDFCTSRNEGATGDIIENKGP